MAKGRGRGEGSDCVRLVLYCYIVLVFLTGLGCLAIGIWLKADRYPASYFMIMRAGSSDETLLAGSALLIVAGLFLCIVGVLGCLGAMGNKKHLLMGFVGLLLIIMLIQLVIGFMAIVFREEIHKYVKDGMREQIRDHYEFENAPGKAWNFVQVRLKCCGVDGSIDYRKSEWWYASNPGVDDWQEADVHVPPTCCVLDLNQEADVRRVDPQDANPRDNPRCQIAARGSQDSHSSWLRDKGCFTALLEVVYTHIHILIGFGIGIGFIQIVGIVCGIYLMRHVSDTPEKQMHTVVQ